MRFGLNVGYSGAQMSLNMELVREADRLGFHSVWSAEAYGSDAVTPLAWMAAQTTRIHVGSGITAKLTDRGRRASASPPAAWSSSSCASTGLGTVEGRSTTTACGTCPPTGSGSGITAVSSTLAESDFAAPGAVTG